MTYETLIAKFRLRILKTIEDYSDAKAFWDDEVLFATKHCRLADADGVHEYAEVLSMLMGQHEQEKLDECEDGDDQIEEEDE